MLEPDLAGMLTWTEGCVQDVRPDYGQSGSEAENMIEELGLGSASLLLSLPLRPIAIQSFGHRNVRDQQ